MAHTRVLHFSHLIFLMLFHQHKEAFSLVTPRKPHLLSKAAITSHGFHLGTCHQSPSLRVNWAETGNHFPGLLIPQADNPAMSQGPTFSPGEENRKWRKEDETCAPNYPNYPINPT
jgi:hypothetical protein